MDTSQTSVLSLDVNKLGERVGKAVHRKFVASGRRVVNLPILFNEEIDALTEKPNNEQRDAIRTKAVSVARQLRLDERR